MNIPNEFKEAIKSTFYDKNITIFSIGTELDEEGGTIDGEKKQIENLDCNVQFQTCEKIQESYGKEIEAECIVTCDTTTASIGNIAKYNNKDYEIKAVIPKDTHCILLLHRKE